MHLTREQKISFDAVRGAGFNPVNSLVLTMRDKRLQKAVASVSAIRDGERYNVRVSIDTRNGFETKILSVDVLDTVIDFEKSRNIYSTQGCVVKEVVRHGVK